MTVPNVVTVTPRTTARSTDPLILNLPAGDPTGKLLLAVVHDYAIGGPKAPGGWDTVVIGDAISIFSKIGVLTDSGGTVTINAFSQEVVSPDNTGYVIEINNASGVEAVSALAKGTGSFAFAPGVQTHYDDVLQIDIIVTDHRSGAPSYEFIAFTQIVEGQPAGGCEVFAETRTQATPRNAPGGDVDFGVSGRWRARTIAVVGNRPPQAPTNLLPGGNGGTVVLDATVDQIFSWTFTDPDPGDTQSAYDFQIDPAGGDPAITSSESTSRPNHTVAAGDLTAGTTYAWRVRTYDADGLMGPYSGYITFTAQNPPPAPTVSSPTAGTTITSHSIGITASDTATDQQQWEVRVVADASGSPNPGTIYSDHVFADSFGLTATFPDVANSHDAHIQVRLLSGNLWSAWTSIHVHVAFTPPPTPSGSVTVDDDTASMTITWTTPSPTGGQPAVDHVEIYASTDGGTTKIRIATELADSDSWTYYTPASGVAYSFQVAATAADGTTATSGWLT